MHLKAIPFGNIYIKQVCIRNVIGTVWHVEAGWIIRGEETKIDR